MKPFHRFFYTFMRLLITPYFATFGRYRWKVYRPKSKNYLVLANHNTNYDFFLFGLSFRKPMYFVAMEAILRLGFVSKIIKFIADPIPRKKGASGKEAAALICERLKKGCNVCMMVEGNRSFSGETGFISSANAPLVRESGAGLITYCIHGGYFVNPRWSKKQRKGPMWGEVVHEYTPEDIAQMTDEEIMEAIRRDVYVNAYTDQEKVHAKYKSKAAAEHLETALFVCPECHCLSSLKSAGKRFFCEKCGYETTLDEYGYFSGDYFHTILDWSKWQYIYLKDALPSYADGVTGLITQDDNIRMKSVNTSDNVEVGTLKLYRDRLEFVSGNSSLMIPLASISHLSVSLINNILFTADGKYYELKSGTHYSALKYLICWRILTGREYI